VFNASLKGREDNIRNISYLWQPKLNIYFIAAKETMKSGILPRIMAYAGSISVERTWRARGQDIHEKREVNPNDTENTGIALKDGWVITFPQRTTKSLTPISKGTAHISKNHNPTVAPIVNNVFRRPFAD